MSSLGAAAFLDCENLTAENVTVATGGVFTKAEDGRIYDLVGQLVWAPADLQIEGGVLTVTAGMKFSGSPFSGNTTITKIVVEDGVTEIAAGMFRAIPNVTEIVLPEGIVSIGASAFADCANLTKINIPSTVKSIGNYAFEYTGELQVDMTKATSLETLGWYLFRGSRIKSFTIPEKVTMLTDRIFQDATELETLNVLGEITSVGGYVFYGTKFTEFDASHLVTVASYAFAGSSIRELNFGVNLEKWNDYAFGSQVHPDEFTEEVKATRAKVEKVTFADNGKLAFLGSSMGFAFSNCWNLKEVKLPNTLLNMLKGTFWGCTSLEEIVIPEGITCLGTNSYGTEYSTTTQDNTFFGCTNLRKVSLPSTLKYITQGAFYQCANLEEINIPDSVRVIGDEAFAGCVKLTDITIPKNIYIIGANAFEGCTGIKNVTIARSTVVKTGAFAGWTAEQTVNFVGDKYSILVLSGTALSDSNANFVFNYKEVAGE